MSEILKMNYSNFIFLHNYGRWLLLMLLLINLINASLAWYTKRKYFQFDAYLLKALVIIAQIQLIVGTLVYTFSPNVSFLNKSYQFSTEFYFLFFALIHPLVMTINVFVLSMVPAKISQLSNEIEKHKTQSLILLIILFILILFIPWPFWNTLSRPYYR